MADHIIDLDKYIFPIISVTEGENVLHLQRFLGTGFWLDDKGNFMTCKHVLDGLMPGQKPAIAQPFSEKSDRYIPILSTICHPNYDIAALGLDVQAWGFTDHEKKQGTYELDVRLLRGYVSRLSADAYGLPSPSLIEVSFGSPCCFSGSPLLVNTEVVGILYSNLETKICAYSIQESTENNSEFRETAYRIYEYGIAHRLSDLSSFLSDCGVSE